VFKPCCCLHIDLSVQHRTSPSGLSAATVIGKNVVVGPNCVLRSCRIDDNVIIGAKSALMEGSIVEENAVLAPGSVLPPARRVPSGELWAGNPAKFVRKLTKDEASAASCLLYIAQPACCLVSPGCSKPRYLFLSPSLITLA
jgi:carbonic anhydrase/acetyltransferase-like protein (isoleucine patch superfamily)